MPVNDGGISGVTLSVRQAPADFIKCSSLLNEYSEPGLAVETTDRQQKSHFHHTTDTLGLCELPQLILYARAQECQPFTVTPHGSRVSLLYHRIL
jgi:hypothetical protein